MISLRWRSEASRPRRTTFPSGVSAGPRTLNEYQLAWTLTGKSEWTWIDHNMRMTLEPGTLLLARPGMFAEWHTHMETRLGAVFFTIEPAPDVIAWPVLRRVVPGPIPALLDYLLWLADEAGPEWISHAEQTIDTIVRMFVSAPLPELPRPEHRALAAALDHVRDEWHRRMRPIGLAELAVAACVSKERLGRLFSDRYGMGFVHGLELVRLTRGEALLTQTNLSVTEIARHCGYTDVLQFSKRFRAAFGSSPLSYRRGSARSSPLASAGLLPLSRRLSAE